MTKEERYEYMKKWRAENRERLKEYNHQYYLSHLLTSQDRPYDPVKQRQRNKAYYENHKNDEEFKRKRRENSRRWRERNRARWNAYYRERRKVKTNEVQV